MEAKEGTKHGNACNNDDTDSLSDDVKAFVTQTLRQVSPGHIDYIQEQYRGEGGVQTKRRSDTPNLPYDIITVVSEILQGDIFRRDTQTYLSRSALARLNRTSRSVHQIKLPYLYGKTVYVTERSFVTSIGRDLPKGWAYTESHMGSCSTASAISCDLTNTSPDISELDMRESFPRIVLISVTKAAKGGGFRLMPTYQEDLRLEPYKPISFNTLQSLCFQSNGRPDEDGTVCVFGIQISKSYSGESGWIHISNITSLCVRSGGGILPATTGDEVNTEGKGMRLHASSNFWFTVNDPIGDHDLALSTISFILDFARLNPQPPVMGAAPITRFNWVLELSCGSSALGILNEALGSRPLPSMSIAIDVEDERFTRVDAQRHLLALAETFSNNWSYDESRRPPDDFLELRAKFKVPSKISKALGYGTERVEILTRGLLSSGINLNGVGFSAAIGTETTFVDTADFQNSLELDLDYDTVQSYPCSHVPVPPEW